MKHFASNVLLNLWRCPLAFALLLCFYSSHVSAQHDDGEMNNEHAEVMNLVPVTSATTTARVNGGNWNTASTWTNGVPGNDARVVIPTGFTVIYNVATGAPNMHWLRIDGKLQFATNQNTVLNVETIVVTPDGTYEQGTAATPIPITYTSIVTFLDRGAIIDKLKISRGLLCHGKARIHGAEVKPFLKTTSALTSGATTATLASSALNWKAGDKIVVTGMKQEWDNSIADFRSQDEVRTIASISGSTLRFSSGLTFNRKVDFPQWGLYPYVANTTRNIQFKSANTTDNKKKGHVMFMHNPDVDVRYAGFYDLGRTDKKIQVSDEEFRADPPGDNPRGKYALHFHRNGHKNLALTTPARVIGCVVLNSPGWGFVNHDSYVEFEDNVSYNVTGAHFVTENGGERGTFKRNLAMTAGGSRGREFKATAKFDFGHTGNGFWFQGGNVIVEQNVATGCRDAGFVWFQRSEPAHYNNANQLVPTQLLLDQQAAAGNTELPAMDLPMMSNKDNTAYANLVGMHTVDIELNGTNPTSSVIEGFVTLNAAEWLGINVEYYRNFTFKNCKILRDNRSHLPGTWAIDAFNFVDHHYPLRTRSADRAINVIIRNYGNGIRNYISEIADGNFEAREMTKWQLIGPNAVDCNSCTKLFERTTPFLGVPLIQNIASEADIIPFPTFSPAAGTISSSQQVTITSVAGANIYYVIGNQGWRPWPSIEYTLKPTSWTVYNASNPPTITGNQVLIAIAEKDGQYSRPRKAFYFVNSSQVSAPTFNVAAGTYDSPRTVTISTATSNSQIRYTTDTSTPTATHGTLINGSSGSVLISSTATLKAIAIKSGMSSSTVTSALYTIDAGTVATPTFTPPPDTYASTQTVTIRTTTPSAQIRYTINGSAPSTSTGTLINGSSGTVTISSTATLRAIAYKSGMTASTVAVGSYTITPPPGGQTKYEAENAALTSVPVSSTAGLTIANAHSGFSGSGYVEYKGGANKVTFTVTVPTTGNYPLIIGYSTTDTKTQTLVVNGVTVSGCTNLVFPASNAWSEITYSSVSLTAGVSNTIEIVSCWGWFKLDYIKVGTGAGARQGFSQGETSEDRTISIYPNPANTNSINLKIYSDRKTNAAISINSSTSQKFVEVESMLHEGYNEIKIPTAGIPNGLYMLVINKGYERIVKKVIFEK